MINQEGVLKLKAGNPESGNLRAGELKAGETAAERDMEQVRKQLEKEQRAIRLKKFTGNKASVFGLAVVLLVIIMAVSGSGYLHQRPIGAECNGTSPGLQSPALVWDGYHGAGRICQSALRGQDFPDGGLYRGAVGRDSGADCGTLRQHQQDCGQYPDANLRRF